MLHGFQESSTGRIVCLHVTLAFPVQQGYPLRHTVAVLSGTLNDKVHVEWTD
jgi:hypothetical protein